MTIGGLTSGPVIVIVNAGGFVTLGLGFTGACALAATVNDKRPEHRGREDGHNGARDRADGSRRHKQLLAVAGGVRRRLSAGGRAPGQARHR